MALCKQHHYIHVKWVAARSPHLDYVLSLTKIVAAGGHFERALGAFLALDIG
jgi:hypothetical protein